MDEIVHLNCCETSDEDPVTLCGMRLSMEEDGFDLTGPIAEMVDAELCVVCTELDENGYCPLNRHCPNGAVPSDDS